MNKQDANINEIVKILKSTMGDLQERRKNIMGRHSEFELTLTNGYPPENKKISVVTLYGTEVKFIYSRKSNTISEGIGEVLTKINRRMRRRVNLFQVPLNAFDVPMKKVVKIGEGENLNKRLRRQMPSLPQDVKFIRFLEAKAHEKLEKKMLKQFEKEHGKLPKHNEQIG